MRNPNRPRLDIQGHRGARGLLPENTPDSFIAALHFGAHAVELDLVMTADGEIVVAHQPWFSHAHCLQPDGRPVTEEEERDHNIFAMTLAEAQRYDCGVVGHKNFPTQVGRPARVPTLAEVVDAVDAFADRHGAPRLRFNVEVKSRRAWEGTFQLPAAELAERVYAVVSSLDLVERSTLQSFDPRVIERFRELDNDVEIAFLVENNDGFVANLDRLSFVPDIYAPWFPYVDESMVAAVHDAGLLLITWTVNDGDDLRRLAEMGVDGLITDFPDVAGKLFELARVGERP